MLSFLRIRNLAIVQDLSLEWGPGLNLLTGETGAGKSILVDALGLALGDRANADVIRGGESRAEVEAVFELPEEAGEVRRWLESAGITAEGDEVVVRREIGDASRSRQFLCDTPVALATLKKFGDLMVEIQGQHQHHALLAMDSQREALDRFAGLESLRRTVGDLARAANEAREALAALDARLASRQAQLEFLEYQRHELEALAPSADEEAALRAERTLAQHAGRRRELSESVYRAVYEEDSAVLGRLAHATSDLRKLVEIDPRLSPSVERLEQAGRLIEEAALEVRDARGGEDADPGRLEEIEARLAAYDRIARKHGTTASGLAPKLEEIRTEIALLSEAEERVAHARESSARARADYLRRARELSARRSDAGSRLAGELRRELSGLGMARCEVSVGVVSDEPAEDAPLREPGLDRVELRLSPNPGETPRPLAEIVSGGELSRVMLAVNGVLGRKRRRKTLIFDEVDAGIGGKVATIVGEKLRELAEAHQVIVITHLAQVASLAEKHFVVEKRVERGRTIAGVRELDREGRVAEIARMVGGRDVSPLARKHAADMLRRAGARTERRSP